MFPTKHVVSFVPYHGEVWPCLCRRAPVPVYEGHTGGGARAWGRGPVIPNVCHRIARTWLASMSAQHQHHNPFLFGKGSIAELDTCVQYCHWLGTQSGLSSAS